MMGSTSNALDKGGENFKNYIMIQMLQKKPQWTDKLRTI